MCFSAGASFAGGVIIAAIGVATVTKIHNKSHLVFGSIPLFFGLQQITEGILWTQLPDPTYPWLLKLSTYFFLFMAQVVWPFMIPLSVLTMEKNLNRRWIIGTLLTCGLILSGYYAFCLVSFPVSPEIVSHHIQYNNSFPHSLALAAFIVYLVVTIVPLFVSSIKRMYLFGILIFVSCALTAIFYTQYLTSVWCFFAALISAVIFWILHDSKRKFRLDKLKALKEEIITPLVSKITKS